MSLGDLFLGSMTRTARSIARLIAISEVVGLHLGYYANEEYERGLATGLNTPEGLVILQRRAEAAEAHQRGIDDREAESKRRAKKAAKRIKRRTKKAAKKSEKRRIRLIEKSQSVADDRAAARA